MKNDSYSRYIRSDMYKEFLSGTKKKVRHCHVTRSNGNSSTEAQVRCHMNYYVD